MCWCTPGDVNEENESVYTLPDSRAGGREMVKHSHEDIPSDLICYYGADPGRPVTVPSGSIAAISSMCFHRSGPNRTANTRHVYLGQYSAEPITVVGIRTVVYQGRQKRGHGVPGHSRASKRSIDLQIRKWKMVRRNPLFSGVRYIILQIQI